MEREEKKLVRNFPLLHQLNKQSKKKTNTAFFFLWLDCGH
jgi:hypothetical protein